jgi:L-threonylcarbamoyladenylate synthase
LSEFGDYTRKVSSHPRQDHAEPAARPLVVKIPPDSHGLPADADLAHLGQILREGGLVALPTETVYGLAANALDPEAVARIFAAKERPSFNPLIVHIAESHEIAGLVLRMPELATRLADAFWPGPLTLVLPRTDAVPDIVTGGLDTVGVRMPSHPVARAVIRAAGVPLAAPSANLFTRVSPTTAEHVLEQLRDRIDAIVDAGPSEVGIESTVVAVDSGPDGDRVVLLRPGGISRAALEAVVGQISDPEIEESAEEARRSPGRIERHYAPQARLLGIERDASGELVVPNAAEGPIAVISCGPVAKSCHADLQFALDRDPSGFARGLYAALHACDAAGCQIIYVERIPAGDPAWEAVADRLQRAGLQ